MLPLKAQPVLSWSLSSKLLPTGEVTAVAALVEESLCVVFTGKSWGSGSWTECTYHSWESFITSSVVFPIQSILPSLSSCSLFCRSAAICSSDRGGLLREKVGCLCLGTVTIVLVSQWGGVYNFASLISCRSYEEIIESFLSSNLCTESSIPFTWHRGFHT